MSSATGTATRATSDNQTKTEETVTSDVTTQASVLTAVAQIAAYFKGDLEELVRRTRVNLPTALGAPERYQEDPALFLGLVCWDIEQLLTDQLINAVTIMICDRPDGNDVYRVRYQATYRVNRLTKGRPAERTNGSIDPPGLVGVDAEFILLVEWQPKTAERRRLLLKPPRYNFIWTPTSKLTDASGTEPYRIGGMVPTTGDLMVTRIESATPRELRNRIIS